MATSFRGWGNGQRYGMDNLPQKGAVDTDGEMVNLLEWGRVHQSSTKSFLFVKISFQKQQLKDKDYTFASNKIKSYEF